MSYELKKYNGIYTVMVDCGEPLKDTDGEYTLKCEQINEWKYTEMELRKGPYLEHCQNKNCPARYLVNVTFSSEWGKLDIQLVPPGPLVKVHRQEV
jgi:hypothetical protein